MNRVILIFLLLAGFSAAAEDPPGLREEVIPDEASPLSANLELIRRLLTPLSFNRFQEGLAQKGQVLRGQAIDPASERLSLYIPARKPEKGYGLMVFVPPWQEAKLPRGWGESFDAAGMIFITATRSGNPENTLNRRMPLALIAAHYALRHFPIDAERVYVGGFSGGSKVAERLALAYPDLFRGALLNAGSDPIGQGGITVPPGDLFRRFQSASRLVFLTGENDRINQEKDQESIKSFQDWCIGGVASQTLSWAGHEAPSAAALTQALKALDRPATAEREPCAAALEGRVAANLDRVEALFAEGKKDEARSVLAETDNRYGGLAAQRSVELDRLIR